MIMHSNDRGHKQKKRKEETEKAFTAKARENHEHPEQAYLHRILNGTRETLEHYKKQETLGNIRDNKH